MSLISRRARCVSPKCASPIRPRPCRMNPIMQNRTRLRFLRRRPWLAYPEEFARNLHIDIRPPHVPTMSRGTTLSSYADLRSTSVRFLWETPNSTINCPRRKVFGIEKVSAELPCRPSTDIQISVGHAGRIPIGLSTKRAFHSALKKNTSNRSGGRETSRLAGYSLRVPPVGFNKARWNWKI